MTVTSVADSARIDALAKRVETFLAEAPRFFGAVLALTPEGQYREVLRAWGLVRGRMQRERDEGRYLILARANAAGGRR